jgi:hypothetical protein
LCIIRKGALAFWIVRLAIGCFYCLELQIVVLGLHFA